MLVYPDPPKHATNPLETVEKRMSYIYRKHFLYVVDKTWASPGPPFEVHHAGLFKVSMNFFFFLDSC